MPRLGCSLLDLTRDLCRFATGIVVPDNDRLFARLAEELPITLHRYPSGSTFNGWVVPDNDNFGIVAVLLFCTPTRVSSAVS